jgi:hypothetical protein
MTIWLQAQGFVHGDRLGESLRTRQPIDFGDGADLVDELRLPPLELLMKTTLHDSRPVSSKLP